MVQRNLFSNRIGFILAAAAAAVGLGNIWRFPYLAAKYGGGIFLLTYLILVVTLGFTLIITEIAIGRKTGMSALNAFGVLHKKWKFMSIFAVFIPLLILSYYSVVTGWLAKFSVTYFTGSGTAFADGGSEFATYIASNIEPVFWTAVPIVIACIVLLFGVQKGIERVSVILLPLLLILMAGMVVYCLTLPGGLDGLAYCVIPDFSKFSVETIFAATGQVFFSLSIAIGIYITYGSYLAKKERIEPMVRRIELFDTGAAFLSALLIIPVIFAFSGGSPESLGSGERLLFVSIPQVFATITFGDILGTFFFVCVLLAALTSLIATMEVPIAGLIDKFHLSRRTAVLIVGCCVFLLSLVINLSYGVWSWITPQGVSLLSLTDFLVNNILMPVFALLTCIFVICIIRMKGIIEEVEAEGNKFVCKKFYAVLIKWICPLCLIGILLFGILSGIGIIAV